MGTRLGQEISKLLGFEQGAARPRAKPKGKAAPEPSTTKQGPTQRTPADLKALMPLNCAYRGLTIVEDRARHRFVATYDHRKILDAVGPPEHMGPLIADLRALTKDSHFG